MLIVYICTIYITLSSIFIYHLHLTDHKAMTDKMQQSTNISIDKTAETKVLDCKEFSRLYDDDINMGSDELLKSENCDKEYVNRLIDKYTKLRNIAHEMFLVYVKMLNTKLPDTKRYHEYS